jgi:hypothetical protein
MGRPFESILDFRGNYSGNYDGRQATLEIFFDNPSADQNVYNANLFFHDVDNAVYYRTVAAQFDITIVNDNNIPWAQIHAFGDCNFSQTDANGDAQGSGTLLWPIIAIHTFDIDYLSGASSWNGQYYGISFTRNA